MEFPRTPSPDNNLQSWLGRFVEAAKGLRPAGSDTMTNTQTGNGVISEVADHVLSKKNCVTYWGEYVRGSSYAMNSIVFQSSASVFTVGTSSFSGSAGHWICESPVPPNVSALPFTDTFLVNYYALYGQQSGICYDPIDNPPSNSPAYQVTGSSGRYWRKVGAASNYITMSVCIDGVPTVYWVDAYPSGSKPPS